MGTVNLRKFSWSFKFLKPPDTYKIGTITPIINSYPLRKYICVGDSGNNRKRKIIFLLIFFSR